MSVDIGFYGLKWKEFLAANEEAESTEHLLAEHAPETEVEITGEDFDNSYDAALDAGMYYDGIRNSLPDDERDRLDEFLAGCFWASDDVALDDVPALEGRDSFQIHDMKPKGEVINLGSVLSPATVARLAALWSSLDREAIREAAESAIEPDEWGESFSSAEEWET